MKTEKMSKREQKVMASTIVALKMVSLKIEKLIQDAEKSINEKMENNYAKCKN